MIPAERPDPDALLRRVQRDAARAKRGKLRVFLGFAPGVGKTFRMLSVARDLVAEQKLDVAIGVVEDHARGETRAQLLGLEIVPRRKVEHRGRTLEELDLDALLARRPKLALVDELAHENAPGSRHKKRWQDVEELLDAGIDVMSTMNVQHLESLNDVVAQITGVQVRETVPDAVIDAADTIELVDISPEELLERLREGKVYLPDQAERAREHFFRRGNLLALRELALRRTAQHVDEDIRAYREEHGVAAPWPASEQILVCVGPAPSSGRLIRAGARMAAGLRCPWVACWVDTPAAGPRSEGRGEQLEAHLRLAESLGAAVVRLEGTSVAEAILGWAQKHNVTRIVIGKPTHSRLRDRLRGSLLDDVVRGSGDIDVHVIRGDADGPPPDDRRRAARRGAPAASYAAAAALAIATLGLALALRATLQLPDLEMLFLLAVMASAVRFGRGPATMTAALGVAAYDFFFVPPFYTFSVADRRYFLTFGMMFAVGFVLSELATRLRSQERAAISREERSAVLYALTRELAAESAPDAIARTALRHAATLFDGDAVLLCPGPNGELAPTPADSDVSLDASDRGVAAWAWEHDKAAGAGTATLPGARVLCTPLRAGAARHGVLALVSRGSAPLEADMRAFLDVFCRQVAAALERARLATEARQAELRAKAEELRSSLLSTVSHDLRTPLAAITGAATSLRDDDALAPATREELVESIVEEAERLERLVANLLDMTRLESGAVALRKDWIPLDEMVGSALTRLEPKLGARSVEVTVADDVPLLEVDPVLFEQLLLNLLENATKHTPEGSPIAVSARRDGERVVIEVADRGPGLPPGLEASLFEKFVRAAPSHVPGAGLGLAICKAIAVAHGGTLLAENRPGGGATFRITLPLGAPPPSVPEPPS